MAVAGNSPDSDICRAIIDLDRYLYLVERGFQVEYQGELLVAERAPSLDRGEALMSTPVLLTPS